MTAMILTDEQQQLVEELGKFAMTRFRPAAFDERAARGSARANLRTLGKEGYLGISMPAAAGGLGRPFVDTMLAIETLAHACPVTAESALFTMCGPAMFVSTWGTPDQVERFVKPVVSGERYCMISLTEETAGTALTDLTTSAEIRDGVCVVNGRKRPSSFPAENENDYYLVFVRFGPGSAGVGAVLVDAGTPGFVINGPYTWMGGAQWAELEFNSVEIPEANVLPAPGISALLASYSIERCAAGAYALGVSQIAIDMAVRYAREREQFGRPIGDFQMVQAKLAEMFLAQEQARLLLYAAVNAFDVGDASRARTLSSAAKIATTKAACEVIDSAMQLHGLVGMTSDLSPLEWLYRLVRPLRVAGGTSDIHRSMIAAAMIGKRIDHRH